MRRIILAIFILILPDAARAAQASPAAPVVRSEQATRVEADPRTGAMVFIVNGREQARLDATGLHVRESIAHGGGDIADGHIGYDAHAAGKGKP